MRRHREGRAAFACPCLRAEGATVEFDEALAGGHIQQHLTIVVDVTDGIATAAGVFEIVACQRPVENLAVLSVRHLELPNLVSRQRDIVARQRISEASGVIAVVALTHREHPRWDRDHRKADRSPLIIQVIHKASHIGHINATIKIYVKP